MPQLGHTNADWARLHTGVAGGGGGSQSSASPAVDESGRSKITFDLASIDGTGLTGPPDGRVAVDYEFCVPATPAHLAEVRRIDPTVRAYPRGRGRIGCGPG